MTPFRTIIEPFRIHAVEPIRFTTRAERDAAIAAAGALCISPEGDARLRQVALA